MTEHQKEVRYLQDSVCTKSEPWQVGQHRVRVEHPDAVLIGECNEGCCDCYRCPHCGLEFRVNAGGD